MSEVAPSVRAVAFAASNTFTNTPTPPASPFTELDLGTLVIPATVKAGDCLILAIESLSEIGGAFDTMSSGWTQLATLEPQTGLGIYPGMKVWWKTATVSDAGSTLLTNVYDCAGVIAYQNAGGSQPIVLGPVGYPSTGDNALLTPQIPSVPVASTVLEIYGVFAENYPTGIAADVFSFPDTPQGSTIAPNGAGGTEIGFCDVVQASTGPGPAFPGFAITTFDVGGCACSVAIPPLAASYTPTLLAPVANSTADLALTPAFDWDYNPSLNNGPQVAYAFRRKIAGASSYQYWNAGTSSFGSSIVWNPSSAESVVFPAGKWTDGNVYNWSVATEDAVSGLQGQFAQDFTVTAQQSASVVVNSPAGFVTSFDPIISWTATFPGSFAQLSYRAVVYADTQYGAVGFSPGSGPSVWDSGTVAGTLSSVIPTIPGSWNGHAMRAYVLVVETNNDPSPWAFSAFQLEVDGPAVPTITATPGVDGVTGAPLVVVTVDGHDNLLSAVDASVETGIGTWVAGSNTTVAQSNAQSADGAESLSLTATAGGAVSAVSGKYPVQH